jgi:type III pantothenate kinase
VVDVGNTNTVFGLFEDDALVADFRVETRRNRTGDEYYAMMEPLIRRAGFPLSGVGAVVVGSVVPRALYPLEQLSIMVTGRKPVVVDHRMETGLKLLYHRPEEMGADRVIDAAYAYRRFGASIVVDFGTATTFDVVNAAGEYLGGCIVPGISISMDALFAYASRLPSVEVSRPDHAIGRSTEEAMRSGVYYGYVAMVDGLVDRLRQEAGITGTVLATGGLARLIARDSKRIDAVLPNLTLDGMLMLYRMSLGLPPGVEREP